MEILNPKQNLALCRLIAGDTTTEAAWKSGVSTATIERWKKQPAFKEKLNKAVSAVYDAAIAELVSGSRDAAIQLKEIIHDADVPSRTKIQAISVLFSNAARAKESYLEARLEKVEALINGIDSEQDSEDRESCEKEI